MSSRPGWPRVRAAEAAFPEGSQTAQQVYDRLELPPIKPDVTRVHLFLSAHDVDPGAAHQS